MKQVHRDPVTGDELTRGEYASWLIQGVIRRWTFLVVILIVTVLCWSTNNSSVLLWWNLGASLLAIMIEAIVGKGMFGQTKRDAVILRHVQAIGEQQMRIIQHIERQLERIASLEEITGKLVDDKEGV